MLWCTGNCSAGRVYGGGVGKNRNTNIWKARGLLSALFWLWCPTYLWRSVGGNQRAGAAKEEKRWVRTPTLMTEAKAPQVAVRVLCFRCVEFSQMSVKTSCFKKNRRAWKTCLCIWGHTGLMWRAPFFSCPALINQNDGSLWAVFISRVTAMTACRALRVFISLKWLHGAAIETSTLKVGTCRRTTGAECCSGFSNRLPVSLLRFFSVYPKCSLFSWYILRSWGCDTDCTLCWRNI